MYVRIHIYIIIYIYHILHCIYIICPVYRVNAHEWISSIQQSWLSPLVFPGSPCGNELLSWIIPIVTG